MARAYIDDIMCGARLLSNLLNKLKTIFKIFFYYNISIKLIKSYLNYSDIALFGQRINSLGLNTSKEKLKTIRVLIYLDMLDVFKYYLSFIG